MSQRNKTCALITQVLISYGCKPGFSTDLPDKFRDEHEVVNFVLIALDSKGLTPDNLPPDKLAWIEESAKEIAVSD